MFISLLWHYNAKNRLMTIISIRNLATSPDTELGPYALLALEPVLQNKPPAVTLSLNGSGFTEGAYRMPDGSARVATPDEVLFALKVGKRLKPSNKN